jgi:hypothetical protein
MEELVVARDPSAPLRMTTAVEVMIIELTSKFGVGSWQFGNS